MVCRYYNWGIGSLLAQIKSQERLVMTKSPLIQNLIHSTKHFLENIKWKTAISPCCDYLSKLAGHEKYNIAIKIIFKKKIT